MAWFVNLVAAFLTLLAIAFYVVVYTIMLKRTTPQNIVIGGAAGALPPVIGWAAVTGSVALPAIVLFAIVFYWTPPHFWALSLRIRQGLRGRPRSRCCRWSGASRRRRRQIVLYSVLLAGDLARPVRRRPDGSDLPRTRRSSSARSSSGRPIRLWRVGSSEERSTAGAIRLYRYSITYLTLLFAAVAIDALVVDPDRLGRI